MLPQVIVLGSINTDLVTRVPFLPEPGVTVIGREFFQASGGKGANQAVAAARSGTSPVVFIAAVGDDDFGRAGLASLRRESLVLDYIQEIAGCASGVASIFVDDQGENCIGVAPGANARLLPDHVASVPQSVFDSARVFLASLEVPLAVVRQGLERAKAAGLTTILNPAPISDRAGVLESLPLVGVLTPNEHEAGQLLDRQIRNPEQAFTAAEDLRELGCGQVVITLGSQGAVVATSAGSSRVPAFPVKPVDTTAAGDAFSGALAVALAERQELRDATRFAAAAGAIAVTRPGAQPSLPTRQAIAEFLDSRR
jgi:ribokinase